MKVFACAVMLHNTQYDGVKSTIFLIIMGVTINLLKRRLRIGWMIIGICERKRSPIGLVRSGLVKCL